MLSRPRALVNPTRLQRCQVSGAAGQFYEVVDEHVPRVEEAPDVSDLEAVFDKRREVEGLVRGAFSRWIHTRSRSALEIASTVHRGEPPLAAALQRCGWGWQVDEAGRSRLDRWVPSRRFRDVPGTR